FPTRRSSDLDTLAVLESEDRNDPLFGLANLRVTVSNFVITGLDAKYGDVGRQARLEVSCTISQRQRDGRIARHTFNHLWQCHAEADHGAHHVRQRFHRPNDVELLQVGADRVRDQVLCKILCGHFKREIETAKSEIKNYSASLGLTHDRQYLSTFVNHLSQIAVIKMCDHVAGFGYPECLGR